MNKFWGISIKRFHAVEADITGGLDDFVSHIQGGGSDKDSDDSTDDDDEEEDADTVDDDEEDDTEYKAKHIFGDDPKEDEDEDEDDEDSDDGEEAIVVDPKDQQIIDLQEQNKKILGLLENTTKPKDKVAEDEKPRDVFASDGFKKLAEVLELDETESGILKSFMEQFGNHVATTAVKDAEARVPSAVDAQITKSTQAKDVKTNFYNTHPALKNVSGYVAQVASAISEQDPNLSLEEVLSKTAESSYKALGIKPTKVKKAKAKAGEATETETKVKKKKPAFATGSKGGGRKKKKKKSPLESGIDAMLQNT